MSWLVALALAEEPVPVTSCVDGRAQVLACELKDGGRLEVCAADGRKGTVSIVLSPAEGAPETREAPRHQAVYERYTRPMVTHLMLAIGEDPDAWIVHDDFEHAETSRGLTRGEARSSCVEESVTGSLMALED